MHDPKLKGRLHRIRVPTLFLWGTARPRLSARTMAAPIAPPFPARAFETIERAGHFPHVEQPSEFAEKIFAFIEDK